MERIWTSELGQHAGERVRLAGWLHRLRQLKDVSFLVLRDAKGFVLTGRDLLANAAYARIRKERREPMPLETSVPGVFAAGDVRAGATNRVASAVGEGSMVVPFAHEYLALT